MEPQTKRTLIATALCLIVLFGWIRIQQILHPQPPPDAATSENVPINDSPAPSIRSDADDAGRISSSEAHVNSETSLTTPAFRTIDDENSVTVTLGDDRQNGEQDSIKNPYIFAAVISPIGASVESIRLSEHRNKVAKDKKHPDHDPYDLLQAVKDPASGQEYRSFVTQSIRMVDEKQEFSLSNVRWSCTKTEDDRSETATLSTLIKRGDQDLFRLTKTYRLEKGSHHLERSLTINNLSDMPHAIVVTEGGPIGIKQEGYRFDGRRVVTAIVDAEGLVVDGENTTRAKVFKSPNASQDLIPAGGHSLWSSVGNKYFTCIVTPLPIPDSKKLYADYLTRATARTYLSDPKNGDDLTAEQVYAPEKPCSPGESQTFTAEIFCGPKSTKLFETMPAAAKERRYEITGNADRSSCAPDFISSLMLWLLTSMFNLFGNYGIAIIALVVIVRLVLHPISKRGQIHMMKMQKNTQRLKPKLEVLQQQYRNDKQKLNEETMKLYREEGVNPAGSVLGCLPMVLQMPIWIALWTTLNTNVDMRHMPFFSYIRDLSSPDTLIAFSSSIHIPLLGMMTGPITSFNLLPIIMSALMYGQQKLTQKLTKPDKPVEPKLDADGKPLPDTMAQQQKMMNFMMIFMGILFYNFPSGLCLYILSSSLLGMGEQYYIRKHIKEKEAGGEFEAKVKGPKKPGFMSRKLEELQKTAEQARLSQYKSTQTKSPGKKRKKARF